jgi:hypothetical protein
MTENQRLVSGQGLKTLVPIRYVPPIMSDSLVVSGTNTCRRSCPDDSETLILLPTGRTSLSNKGLYDDGSDVSSSCSAKLYAIRQNSRADRFTVYDPRFNGFCSDTFRPYLDERSGTVKYDYDDIDSVKMMQYLTRNQLDVFNIMAVENFTNKCIEQRDSMQTEWLQRRSADRLQRRLYPMHTNGTKK